MTIGTQQNTSQAQQQQEDGKFLSLKDRLARYNNAFGGTTAAPPPLPTGKAQYTSAGVQRAVEQQRSKPDLREPSPRNSITDTTSSPSQYRRSSETPAPLSHYQRSGATRGSQFENLKGGAHASTPDLSSFKEQKVQQDNGAGGKSLKLADRLAAYQQAASATGSTASLHTSREALPGGGGDKWSSHGRLFGAGAGNTGSQNKLQGSRDQLSQNKLQGSRDQLSQNKLQGSRDQLSARDQNLNKGSTTSSYTRPAATTSSTTPSTSTPSKPAPTTAAASSAPAGKFGGTPRCESCSKPVYLVEQLTLDGKIFHKTCLKCAHCKATLKMGNLASMGGVYYCKPHFKQLFKTKGNYSEGFGKEDPKKAWVAGQTAAPSSGGAAALASAGRAIVSGSQPELAAASQEEGEAEQKERQAEHRDSSVSLERQESRTTERNESTIDMPTTETTNKAAEPKSQQQEDRQSSVAERKQEENRASSVEATQQEESRHSSVAKTQEEESRASSAAHSANTDGQEQKDLDATLAEGAGKIRISEVRQSKGVEQMVSDERAENETRSDEDEDEDQEEEEMDD
ncbi:LIM domain-containing protein 2 [Rhizophlyctis rosea]|nr:LIM domain-containing protein 2 [Rhizophlyctis rosea]